MADASNVTFEEANRRRWQAIVAGAGVAGSCVALALARTGLEVLLIEKGRHPRAKTCGGCLHPAGYAALGAMGLARLPELSAAPLLDLVELRWAGRRPVRIPLPEAAPYRAVERPSLDAALLREAIGAGVRYLDGCQVLDSEAGGRNCRSVRVRGAAGEAVLRADFAVACEGLNSPLARSAGLVRPARPWWRPKVGFSLDAEGEAAVAPSSIAMHCEDWGYLGVVRLADGRWHLAAAVRPGVLREAGAVELAAGTLRRHGLEGLHPLPESLVTAPRLTHSLVRPWAERLFVAGDAAGYVEPVTGEGMTWAVLAAQGVARAASRGWTPETGPAYEALWRRDVARGRGLVRLSAFALDRRPARRAAWWALSAAPPLRRLAGRMAAR